MAAASIPSLVALLFKLVFLFYVFRAPRHDASTRLFAAMLMSLCAHNIIEFAALNHFATSGLDATMSHYGYAYFAAAIIAIAIVVHLSLLLSIDGWDRIRWMAGMIYLPVLILEYLLLHTDKLVAGFEAFQGYTIIRVPGSLYSLFETYALIYALAGLFYIVYGARSSRSSAIKRTRNRWWLVGLLPLILLHLYFIIANHFGLAKISSTVSIPIAFTFFLLTTTYATHQYRLVDVEFYIPWSRVRKRKTVFYQRIQAMVAEIADLRTIEGVLDMLAGGLRCQVALVGGPRPMAALAKGQKAGEKETLLLADFPMKALRKIEHIVVTHEIADSQPTLHRLMQRYKVGAVVPFCSYSGGVTNWMLFGETFSDQVYSPLDFKIVETLFGRVADHFLDDSLLLRSELEDVNAEAREYRRRLSVVNCDIEILRKSAEEIEAENSALRSEKADLRRQNFKVIDNSDLPEKILSGEQTLEEHLAEYERELIVLSLRGLRGNLVKTARELGIEVRTLRYLMRRHRLKVEDFY